MDAKTPLWEPVSIEAEQALLGALLRNNQAFAVIADMLEPHHFFEPIHQKIFEVVKAMCSAGKAATLITVKSVLPEDEIARGMNVTQYLARIAAEATTIANAKDYAQVIRDMFDRRVISEVAAQLSPAEAADAGEIAGWAIEQLDGIVASRASTSSPRVTMRDAVVRAIDAAASAYANDGAVAGLTTGLRDLDRKTHGFQAGDLIILAGRPGMGKSGLMLTMARKQAEQGKKVEIESLEMGDVSLTQRMIADYCYDETMHGDELLKYVHMRSGRFSEKTFERIRKAGIHLAGLPIEIEQRPRRTFAQIAARARLRKRMSGLDVLYVDHLQIVNPSANYRGNRNGELGEITASAKALAKELGIPVVLLSQLSRGVEARENKRPMMSDLRESGNIEQDADTILLLFREEYYLQNAEPRAGTPEHELWQTRLALVHGKLEVIVGKQRSGPTGIVECACDIGANAFRDLANDANMPERMV